MQFCFAQEELEKEEETSKTVNLELVFGYHWKPGTGKSVCLTHVVQQKDELILWLLWLFMMENI